MSGPRPRVAKRGLTLVESVIASAILAVAITAVFSAVASGRAHADLAAEDLASTVAAEDLLARILQNDPETLIEWDGYVESPSKLVDGQGSLLGSAVQRVGRQVRVESTSQSLHGSEPISGWLVTVEMTNANDRLIHAISRWIPAPEETQ
jgi:prepilin-type N-terminal cleavage/methylation domain-containing protein